MRLLIPIMGALALAGCETERAPETADVAAQGIPPAIKVTTSEQRHIVYVGTGVHALSEQERLGLVGFLSDASVGNPDALHIRLRGTVPPGQLEPITKAIVAAGIQPGKVEIESVPASDLGAGPGHPPGAAVEVVASVSHVDFPSCPRQSWTTIGGEDNPTSSNLGCSTITNLEAMIADPRDLVQGESGGATDAQLTNAAIERLRTDKTKRLTQSNTSSAVSSSGGSQ